MLAPFILFYLSTPQTLLATNGLISQDDIESALPEIQVMNTMDRNLSRKDSLVYSPRSSIYMMGAQLNREEIFKVKKEKSKKCRLKFLDPRR